MDAVEVLHFIQLLKFGSEVCNAPIQQFEFACAVKNHPPLERRAVNVNYIFRSVVNTDCIPLFSSCVFLVMTKTS